jgi:formate hydrogenlyase transcriptional activator
LRDSRAPDLPATSSIADTGLRAERDRLRLLLDVTNLLVSRRDLADLFQELSVAVGQTIAHEYASISLYPDPPDGTADVRLVVLDGERRPSLEGRMFPMSAGAALAFGRGEALTYEFSWLQAQNPSVAAALAPLALESFCSIQLATARGPLGIISVASRRPDAFGAEDVRLLRQVCAQIAIGIENGLAYDEIRRLKDQVLSEKRYLEEEILEEHGFRDIIGQSLALRRVLQQVETVAATDATVLLVGETGTGKELVARAIHDRSARRSQAFVRVNCAAIPPPLVEAEMFGHERGAFTGAAAARPGRFEVAHRGTLFLDEIGDLPFAVQPKLLRALQEREVERLGSSTPVRVDVRLIAATNRDLMVMVASGEFRDDLFYRLNVFPVRLPPLRERRDDIPALAAHFVRKHAHRLKRTIEAIPSQTMDALCRWDWPGNIRELENVIERATILATDGVLRTSLAPRDPDRGAESHAPLDAVQREAILSMLRASRGIVGGPDGAAARLGLKRTTLQARMRKLGITRPQY